MLVILIAIQRDNKSFHMDSYQKNETHQLVGKPHTKKHTSRETEREGEEGIVLFLARPGRGCSVDWQLCRR